MARIEVDRDGGVSVSLADLTGADLRVLDLALSYFTDVVRKQPRALPNPGDTEVLSRLHQQVINVKRDS